MFIGTYDDVMKTILSLLVDFRLDYVNAILSRVSEKNITRLERTENVLAWIVTRKYEQRGITQSLKKQQWLPIKWQIDFKILVTAHRHRKTTLPLFQHRVVQPYYETFTLEC